jgi:hypothetical protein
MQPLTKKDVDARDKRGHNEVDPINERSINGVDLTFGTHLARVHEPNVKSKTPLET